MWFLREKWVELAFQVAGAAVFLTVAGAAGIGAGAGLFLLLAASVSLCYLAGVYSVSVRRRPLGIAVRAAVADVAILAAGAALFGLGRALATVGAQAGFQLVVRLVILVIRRRERRVIVFGSGALPDAVLPALTGRVSTVSRARSASELEAAADGAARRGATTLVVDGEDAKDPDVRVVLARAAAAGARVMDCASFLERFEGAVPAASVSERWLEGDTGFALLRTRWAPLLKRSADFAVSLVALIVASPGLGLCALLVKVTSAGPALFVQERIGRGGRPFRMLKFRTMVLHDPGAHSRYPARRDPRITPVGALLRRTHLDELPQLVNILRGDMSLIGPRAEWSVLVADYRARIPWYDLRHAVRPGVTGWAQVCYRYGFSADDAAEKLRYDLYYVKHYSPFLDLVVTARTVKTVLLGWAKDARF